VNADLLRRLSLVAMIAAIVSGIVSLWQLFASPTPNFVPATISVVALILGLVMDRQARRQEDRNAG
jgi:multidrug efflux pump subunit AcrB